MTEPSRDLDAAFAQVADRWDPQRTERTLVELKRKRQRAQRVRTASAIGAVAALALLGLWQTRVTSPSAAPLAGTSSEPARMALADGSAVFLQEPTSRVRVRQEVRGRTELELQAGKARFDVSHVEQRVFRVHSGNVTIEVLGTEFELERDAERTRVAVLRGRVAVSWNGGREELAAGEAGWFPRTRDAEAEAEAPQLGAAADARAPGPAQRGARAAVRKPRAQAADAWREPAEQGDFDRAYELLRRAPQPSPDDVEELLLAADTARLSGHPAAALPFLKQVISGHAQDSRAPLAAFTLGGLLMQQLGQPREAEAAYAKARALSLNSSLAEDALARQVEAAHRAGDASRARTLAEEYVSRYPRGRRVHAVQRFGGLTR